MSVGVPLVKAYQAPHFSNRRAQKVTVVPDNILSRSFRGLNDDPMLDELFETVAWLVDYTHKQELWDISHKLEGILDAILMQKDRQDRGVYMFRSKRNSALSNLDSETFHALRKEIVNRTVKSVL